MQTLLTLETKKYELKLENFEGPLDLLCHLIDKNKIDIYKVKISDIADQYIDYINKMESMNLDVTSEFLVMASTLLYIKSKGLLPKVVEDETEITEEELIKRIIEYKKYKEISKIFKENIQIYSNRFYKLPDNIELPKQVIEKTYTKDVISDKYKELLDRKKNVLNPNSINIEKIAISETITVVSKVKIIFKELLKRPKFIFNKLFSIKEQSKVDVITAFTGLLELTRRNKVLATQQETFGDIIVEKAKKQAKKD